MSAETEESQKGVEPERLRLCERALDALEGGADANELAATLAEEGEISLIDAGYIAGTLEEALRQSATGSPATPSQAARFTLAQLTSGTDPEEVAAALGQSFGLTSHAADECVRVTLMALGIVREETFTILDLSPKVRIAAGGVSFAILMGFTVFSLNRAEPGATVLVAVGALLGSFGLLIHGLIGWWKDR